MSPRDRSPTGVGRSLQVVLLEDNHADAVLLQAELVRQGLILPVTVVTSRSEYRLAVEMLQPDLVLADHTLPDIDGWEALRMAQAVVPGVPFVLVTGTLGPEQANDFVRAGATDYVLKGQLARLGPMIRRFREAKHREATWQAAEAARLAGEAYLRSMDRAYGPLLSVLDDTQDIVGMTRRDGTLRYLNPAGRHFLGLDTESNLSTLTLAALQPGWAVKRLEEEGFQTAARAGNWSGVSAVRTRGGEELAMCQTLLAYRAATGEVRDFTFHLRPLPPDQRAEGNGSAAKEK